MVGLLAASPQGAVLLLTWGNFRAFLPVGLDDDSLAALQDDPSLRDVTVLLLADSRLAALKPPAWLRHFNPQLVLLSIAAGDLRGLPDAETLDALEGYNLLRTDQNGWIDLITDGKQMWVEVESR